MPVYRLPVRITHPSLGGEGANVWHCRTGGGIGEDATVNRVIGWLEDFYTSINQAYPSGAAIIFDGVATEVGTEEPQMREGLDTFTVAGASTPDVMPPANALCISWRTSLATRSGRGRTFLGPLATANQQSDGTPAAATLAFVRAAATALVDLSSGVDPDGAALCVWSPTDSLARDFTGSNVRDRFAVLRSRRD